MSASLQRTRRRQQREQTRQVILDAADRFLREHPYRELSVDALMADTGFTRTNFYRHFDDLPQLVLQLLTDIGGELYDIAQRWAASIDLETAAREALTGIVDFFDRHGPVVRAIADAASDDDQIEAGYRAMLEVFVDLTDKRLTQLVAEGSMAPMPTREVSRALNAMNERYLLESLGRTPRTDPKVVLETLLTVWLRAVGPGVAVGDATTSGL